MPASSAGLRPRTNRPHGTWTKRVVGPLVEIKVSPGCNDAVQRAVHRQRVVINGEFPFAPDPFTSAKSPAGHCSIHLLLLSERAVLYDEGRVDARTPASPNIHLAKLSLCFRLPLRLSTRLQQTLCGLRACLGASNSTSHREAVRQGDPTSDR